MEQPFENQKHAFCIDGAIKSYDDNDNHSKLCWSVLIMRFTWPFCPERLPVSNSPENYHQHLWWWCCWWWWWWWCCRRRWWWWWWWQMLPVGHQYPWLGFDTAGTGSGTSPQVADFYIKLIMMMEAVAIRLAYLFKLETDKCPVHDWIFFVYFLWQFDLGHLPTTQSIFEYFDHFMIGYLTIWHFILGHCMLAH